MKNIIFGGAGFIGYHFSKELLKNGVEFSIVDSLENEDSNSRYSEGLFKSCNFNQIDISKDLNFNSNVLDCENAFFFIANTSTVKSSFELKPQIFQSLVTLSNLLEHWAARKKFPKNITLLSSRAVYGEGVWEDFRGEQFYAQQRQIKDLENKNWKKFKDRIGEKFLPHNASSQVPNPISTYGQVKLLQETMLRNWTILNGVNLTILRLQNVIGTHQYGKNSYSAIINFMIRNLHLKQSIEIYEQGQISRDFINVRDLSSFLMEFTKVQADQTVLVDVGSGIETSILDLGNLLITNFPNSKLEVTNKWRQGDVLKAFTKIGKDNSHKDWLPRVPLEDTILEISDFIELSL